MSVAAANPCIPKAPTIYTIDTVEDLSWVKQPNDGDIALMVKDGAVLMWVFESSYTGEVNTGTAIAGGCQGAWVLGTSPINGLIFGADPTGQADSTEAIQDVIDLSISLGGREIFFPAGTYRHSGLTVGTGVVLTGEGSGRVVGGAVTAFIYTGTGVAIQGNGAPVFSFGVRDMTFEGTDGNGGTGFLLDSFEYPMFENVLIGKFRNAGNTGRGIRMINTYGNCAHGRFISITFEDTTKAIEMDSVNSSFSVGYHYWNGIVVYRELDGIDLKSTQDNGGINNIFVGVYFQGSPSLPAGTYIRIEGHGNLFLGVNVDQSVAGDVILNFAATDAANNYLRFLDGFEVSKYVSSFTTGAPNTLDFGGYVAHAPGERFLIRDPSAITTFALQSTGGLSVEQHYGNDLAGSQAWRWILQGATATPAFMLFRFGGICNYWDGATTIVYSGGVAVTTTTAGNFGVAGDIELSGNIKILNSQGVAFEDSGGLSELGVTLTASNNMQLMSPTASGSIQLICRAASGVINLFPAGVVGAASFDGNSTAGETRMLLWDVDTAALKRVKVGANGTGPGGVGRALYIDNI